MIPTLKYKDFEGTAELDIDRGVCRGKLLFIDDLITYESATPKGLEKAFRDAVEDYVETCKEIGREPQRPFKGSFNVRVPPGMHRAAALRAAREQISLNEVVMRALQVSLGGRAEVNHNHSVKITLEPQGVETVTVAASSPQVLSTVNHAVH